MPSYDLLSDDVSSYKFQDVISKAIESSKIELMLISDDEEIKKLHYFIFSTSEDIDYYTVENIGEDEISLLFEMDIVIFHKDDEELKSEILNLIEENNLPIFFFEISKDRYIRQRDILIAHNRGVDRLFKRNFQFEEYIVAIEMHLKSNFYTKKLLELKLDQNILYEKFEFDKKVEELLKKRLFFSILEYGYSSDIDIENYNLRKILREEDLIYIDRSKSKISFLIMNVVPKLSKEIIQKRIKNFSITLEEIDSYSAFEIVYESD
jgi:hypothetical protein